MTVPTPRSSRRHPRLAVLVLVVAAVLIVVAVLQTRSTLSSKHSEAGMTLGTVRSADAQAGGRLKLTVGYSVARTSRTVTGEVHAASFNGQGKTVWVCFDPTDPGQAHLRLPMDDLCS